MPSHKAFLITLTAEATNNPNTAAALAELEKVAAAWIERQWRKTDLRTH